MEFSDRVTFGRWEAVTLLINLICTKIFLYFARMTVEDAGTAGWIMTLYIGLIVFALIFAFLRLMRRFEGKDLIDIAEATGGRVLKIVTGLVIFTMLLYLVTTVLREFAEDMKVVALPSSPISYIILFFMAGIIAGSFLGIEALVRYHAIIVPVIATGFLVILLGALSKMDFTNVLPFWGTGGQDILGKGFFKISIFGELLILFLLPPFLKINQNMKKVGYTALGFSTGFFVTGSLAYILTFPYPSSLESFLPIYQMARLIEFGRFFQRIEAVFVFIWGMAAFLYLSAVFYFMVYVFAKTAGLKYLRPLILPMSVIVFSAAFLPPNLMSVIRMNTQFFSRYAWLVTFLFTGVILVAANIRRKGRKDGPAHDEA